MKKRADDTELLIQREHHGTGSEYDEESNRKTHPESLGDFDQWPHVFNLTNCIVGVSVLAMPYCFQQCGILLAVLMIGFCSVLTKYTCYFLSKGAFIARRSSYEALALASLGPVGRRAVEVMMLAFLMSSIVSFLVMIGDIGPHIVADYLELEAPTSRLRILVMVLVLLFVICPLSAIQDLGNFSMISSAAVVFYVIFVIRVFVEAVPTLWEGSWSIHVVWWRPEGFLKCLPIISMALSCQTQLFCVLDCIRNATAEHVDTVVSSAINICSGMYAAVGLFGYVAFYNKELHGDVLVNLNATLFTQLLKLSFMLSIAVSIPLMLFPARIALFNLCLRPSRSELPVSNLQHSTFHILTFVILIINLVIAIIVPNVEFILGLTGSLIGSLVAIIIPSLMFLFVTKEKEHSSVPVAKVCIVVGFTILCASTWATLNADRKSQLVDRPLPKAIVDEIALKTLEKLEEKVLDSTLNISQKLDEVADLAKHGKEKEAEKLLLEMKMQQQEQEKLIKKQEEMVVELNKHVGFHHTDESKDKDAEKPRENSQAEVEEKKNKRTVIENGSFLKETINIIPEEKEERNERDVDDSAKAVHIGVTLKQSDSQKAEMPENERIVDKKPQQLEQIDSPTANTKRN